MASKSQQAEEFEMEVMNEGRVLPGDGNVEAVVNAIDEDVEAAGVVVDEDVEAAGVVVDEDVEAADVLEEVVVNVVRPVGQSGNAKVQGGGGRSDRVGRFRRAVRCIRTFQNHTTSLIAILYFVIGVVALGVQQHVGLPDGKPTALCNETMEMKNLTIELLPYLNGTQDKNTTEKLLQILHNHTDKDHVQNVCRPASTVDWLPGLATLFTAVWTMSDCLSSFLTAMVTIRLRDATEPVFFHFVIIFVS